MTFAKVAVPVTASSTSKMSATPSTRSSASARCMFLFFVTRMVRRREREALMRRADLAARARRAALAARPGGRRRRRDQGGADAPTQVIPALQSPVNVARRQVEDLVDRDADRVAQQVRAWMTED